MFRKIKTTDVRVAAREYAFLLLTVRLRSRQEMATRLEKKGFSADIVSATVDFLSQHQFLDDSSFASAWITCRLKRNFGLGRIQKELELKGISRDIIRDKFDGIKQEYSEPETVKKLALQRFAKIKPADKITARRRVLGYLLRRGFSADVVMETLNWIK